MYVYMILYVGKTCIGCCLRKAWEMVEAREIYKIALRAPGPLWARPLWAGTSMGPPGLLWVLLGCCGLCPCGPGTYGLPGPYGPGPNGPPGPLWAAPSLSLWALLGGALMGRPGPLWACPLWAFLGPHGPIPHGPHGLIFFCYSPDPRSKVINVSSSYIYAEFCMSKPILKARHFSLCVCVCVRASSFSSSLSSSIVTMGWSLAERLQFVTCVHVSLWRPFLEGNGFIIS